MNTIRIENRFRNTPAACIWMQAGVVAKKWCKTDFDCVACRFDKAMRRLAAENEKRRAAGAAPDTRRAKIVFWKDPLLDLPPWKRPCIHHLKRRIEFRACTNEYRCDNCEFDQYFDDEYTVHAIVRPVDVLTVEGFKIPQGFYLHQGHAWVKLEEGGEARIGLDDFAQRLFGPADRFESPLVGKAVCQDRPAIRIKRGSQSAAIQSPVSGVITAVNPKLRKEGALANANPYCDGWIARIHTRNLRQDLKHLLMGSEATGYLQDEVRRLYQVVEEQAGPLAADGGHFGNDIYGNLPGMAWKRLANLFLRT